MERRLAPDTEISREKLCEKRKKKVEREKESPLGTDRGRPY